MLGNIGVYFRTERKIEESPGTSPPADCSA